MSLAQLLGLASRPVAITFCATPPDGVAHVAAREPAGCGYWRRAAAGEVFYTTADDHKACPVGAHTHHVELTAEEQKGLEGLVGTMIGLEYLKPEDVPQIPLEHPAFQPAELYAPEAAGKVKAEFGGETSTVRVVNDQVKSAARALPDVSLIPLDPERSVAV